MLGRRLVQAVTLKRDAFLWMVFDARANGDAVLVVAGVYLAWIVLFGLFNLEPFGGLGFTLNLFVRVFVNGAFAWIIATAAVWALGAYVLEGSGRFGTTLPVAGFAHAPLVLVPIGARLGIGFGLSALAAGAWAVAMLTVGAQVALELPREKALLAAGGGVVVWWIFFFLF